jgi:hypothetical protein
MHDDKQEQRGGVPFGHRRHHKGFFFFASDTGFAYTVLIKAYDQSKGR